MDQAAIAVDTDSIEIRRRVGIEKEFRRRTPSSEPVASTLHPRQMGKVQHGVEGEALETGVGGWESPERQQLGASYGCSWILKTVRREAGSTYLGAGELFRTIGKRNHDPRGLRKK